MRPHATYRVLLYVSSTAGIFNVACSYQKTDEEVEDMNKKTRQPWRVSLAEVKLAMLVQDLRRPVQT